MTACSSADWDREFWNWAAKAAPIAILSSIQARTIEYVQKMGHEAPGIYC